MSDFYSVLRETIVQRGLSDAGVRQEVYDQARRVLVEQLWAYIPPLAEDEIDARVGQFDTAVDQIERDLAAPEEAEPAPLYDDGPVEELPHAREASPPVYGAYDEEADYAAVAGLEAGRDRYRSSPAGRSAAYDRADRPQALRSAALFEAIEAGPEHDTLEREPVAPTEEGAFADGGEAGYSDEQRDRYPKHTDFVETDDFDEPTDEPLPVVRPRRPGRSQFGYGADEAFDDPALGNEPGAEPREDGEPATRWPIGKDKAPGRGRRERHTVRILVTLIATLACVLVGFALYVFYPVLFGVAAPGRSEPAQLAAQVVGDPKSAEETPKQNLAVTKSYIVFDGHDPTIFESSSGNPIRFDQDALGGFARVASAAGAAGVKASIPPSVAAALGGQNVRVTIVARSARENGAGGFRFAYQSGLAISFWQEAKIAADYTALGMVWRVPALKANSPAGDFVVIEPGIPGDGTAIEIQSIKIDALAS